MLDKDQMLAKADQPGVEAMRLHPFYKGKIEVVPKACIRDFMDFAIWYTPGVAKPCLDIRDNPEMVFEHTNKGNTVAVISDGTRVFCGRQTSSSADRRIGASGGTPITGIPNKG